jgi:hypothetical protein
LSPLILARRRHPAGLYVDQPDQDFRARRRTACGRYQEAGYDQPNHPANPHRRLLE